MEGFGRSQAISFTIGSRVFLGLGYGKTLTENTFLRDLWEFDSKKNYWTQRTDLPDSAINPVTQKWEKISNHIDGVAFATNNKGYLATGCWYPGANPKETDFLEYDPTLNTWKMLADFPGDPRNGALAFTINNIGYVGFGWGDRIYKDMYAFNPATNSWTITNASNSPPKRKDGVAFVINGIAYVCGGTDAYGAFLNDMWAFDPASNTWTEKSKITGDLKRIQAVAFAANGKGYIATGKDTTKTLTTVWEYDPGTDVWTMKSGFEAGKRYDAVAFVVNDTGYVASGYNPDISAPNNPYCDDTWGFVPNVANDPTTR